MNKQTIQPQNQDCFYKDNRPSWKPKPEKFSRNDFPIANSSIGKHYLHNKLARGVNQNLSQLSSDRFDKTQKAVVFVPKSPEKDQFPTLHLEYSKAETSQIRSKIMSHHQLPLLSSWVNKKNSLKSLGTHFAKALAALPPSE